jgi:hypothetical protein
LLVACHDKEFCGWMNDIDFFENCGGVVGDGLLSEMINNEFETTVWTE